MELVIVRLDLKMRLVLFGTLFSTVGKEAGAVEGKPWDSELGGDCSRPGVKDVGNDAVWLHVADETFELGLEHEKG